MEARLLEYYNRELAYLREMGAEFARAHPKIAGRLGMHGIEVADPYVERLLEGVSFLTARVQLKMDAAFPDFTQRLLEIVHPNYLAPTPAMAVVQLEPSMNEGSLARGFTLPRGTGLRAHLARGEQTPCEFVTAHTVRLWPMRVAHAAFGRVPEFASRVARDPAVRPARAALTIELELGGGVTLGDLALEELSFHLAGPDAAMHRLLELVAGHTAGVLCHEPGRAPGWLARLPAGAVRHEGFADGEALLPCDARSFQGLRVLQEYFAFPARFLFFGVSGLARALATAPAHARRFAVTILIDEPAAELEGVIGAEHMALHCTPAINLFARRADRIAVTPRTREYHLVVDRTRPLDYEVFAVTGVTGHRAGSGEQVFAPFYGTAASSGGDAPAYYALRREPRLMPASAGREAPRTGYGGGEVYLSLVDRAQPPFADDLRHLTVDTFCTNRDLALIMPTGGETDFTLRVSAPVAAARVLRGPSRPRPALGTHAQAWHLISHLGLNYLNLLDLDQEAGAAALRELLRIYADLADPAVARQIEGLRHVRVTPTHHRLPSPGPIVYGRGVRVDVTVDEAAFSGLTPYLFGAVLDHFFARHVSLNTLSELALGSLQHGPRARFSPRLGTRPIV